MIKRYVVFLRSKNLDSAYDDMAVYLAFLGREVYETLWDAKVFE